MAKHDQEKPVDTPADYYHIAVDTIQKLQDDVQREIDHCPPYDSNLLRRLKGQITVLIQAKFNISANLGQIVWPTPNHWGKHTQNEDD